MTRPEIIRRLEVALAHCAGDLLVALNREGADREEIAHLEGHYAGLRQALNLVQRA